MTTTPHTHDDEAVEEPEPSPEYLALPKREREEMDLMVENIQQLQNHVDQNIGILGEPVFHLARILIGHDLMIRTLRRELIEARSRIIDLEDRIS